MEIFGKPYRAIIVRPETRLSFAGPVNANRSWLNVWAGDRVVQSGKPEQIRSVTVYDVLPVSECDKEVPCGADWLAQDGESTAKGHAVADFLRRVLRLSDRAAPGGYRGEAAAPATSGRAAATIAVAGTESPP